MTVTSINQVVGVRIGWIDMFRIIFSISEKFNKEFLKRVQEEVNETMDEKTMFKVIDKMVSDHEEERALKVEKNKYKKKYQVFEKEAWDLVKGRMSLEARRKLRDRKEKALSMKNDPDLIALIEKHGEGNELFEQYLYKCFLEKDSVGLLTDMIRGTCTKPNEDTEWDDIVMSVHEMVGDWTAGFQDEGVLITPYCEESKITWHGNEYGSDVSQKQLDNGTRLEVFRITHDITDDTPEGDQFVIGIKIGETAWGRSEGEQLRCLDLETITKAFETTRKAVSAVRQEFTAIKNDWTVGLYTVQNDCRCCS